jgi:hypothetical protein
MVGTIALTVLGGVVLTLLKLGIDLRRNIQKAKSTGLPYIVGREFNLFSFVRAFNCNHDDEMANLVALQIVI